jgi:hypothetical protein
LFQNAPRPKAGAIIGEINPVMKKVKQNKKVGAGAILEEINPV